MPPSFWGIFMSSVVDICNQALANLGDSATITSIDPPEGSPQAEHCARFYPMALSTLLEAHNWKFATRRGTLAQVTNPSSTWDYAYAKPSDCITMMAIIDPEASDDYSASIGTNAAAYTPQKFVMETLEDGSEVILTNQENAVARYTVSITDAAKFSPLFVECLTWLLTAKIAGPVVKGAEGRAAAKDALSNFSAWYGKATASDASNQYVNPAQQVDWMNNR